MHRDIQHFRIARKLLLESTDKIAGCVRVTQIYGAANRVQSETFLLRGLRNFREYGFEQGHGFAAMARFRELRYGSRRRSIRGGQADHSERGREQNPYHEFIVLPD